MAKPFCYVTKGGRAVKSQELNNFSLSGQSKQLLDSFSEKYSSHGLVQPLYPLQSLVLLLEYNTYHYRCCRTKARDTAGLGWSIVPTVDNPEEENRQKLKDFFNSLPTPITKILDNSMFDYESIAQGAIEVAREDGTPVFMEHMPAFTVRIHRSFNKFAQLRGGKMNWFKRFGYPKDIDIKTGREYNLGELDEQDRANELLWFTNYTPRSDYYGLPDIFPAIGAIYGDISRRDYNISFFDNFGVPAYAVFITGNFDPGEDILDEKGNETGRTQLEETIEEHFKDLHQNPHSTLILTIPTKDGEGDVAAKFVPLSVEVKEASFRLYRKDNRDEVLSAHGMDPYRLGIAEVGSLGGSTAEESTEIYKRSVIEPRQETLESLINNLIVQDGFGIYDYKFKLDDIDAADEGKDLEMAIKLFEHAALTPNKLIENFGQKFGQEKHDSPEMESFYYQGQPIEQLYSGEAKATEDVMKAFRSKLVEIAEKVDKNA